MFFRKDTQHSLAEAEPRLSPVLAKTIEDAILLGGVRELDEALHFADMDVDFSKDLRCGLEALRHFRAYYGTGQALEPQDPLQRQKAAVMDIAWGAELLDLMRHTGKIVGFSRA